MTASWHMWELGTALGQKLLGQSKNISGKLEGAVPEGVGEQGLSMRAQASREQVVRPEARAGHWHSHQGSSGSDSKTGFGECFCSWEERWGNPSEAFLCFMTFYVLETTATKMSLGFIFFATFPADFAPGKLLSCLLLWSRGLAPQCLIQSVTFGVQSRRSVSPDCAPL